MDEAFVVLVIDGDRQCKVFPFATRRAAEEALAWFTEKCSGVEAALVDDHDRYEEDA